MCGLERAKDAFPGALQDPALSTATVPTRAVSCLDPRRKKDGGGESGMGWVVTHLDQRFPWGGAFLDNSILGFSIPAL